MFPHSCEINKNLGYGFGMGVTGAALATIISQAVSSTWCLIFLSGKKTNLRLKKEYLPLQSEIIVPCIMLGLATFIMQASESVIQVCFNSSLLKYGGDVAVGAMTICTSILQFAMLPMQGIGQGAQPISSYNYGAGNANRVRGTFMLLLKVCVAYSVVLFLAIMPHLVSDPAKGVFMAEPIADFLAVCFTSVLFFVQFRKALKKLS